MYSSIDPWELKVGDTVMLNSGGPKMTVEKIFSSNERILAIWYNDITKEYSKEEFPTKAVTKKIG